MGLENAPQHQVNVPVGPLVTPASEVVTPNAVAAMADAFRKGIITSEDILQRHGELARSKEKAELQSLSEQMSPEAIAARSAQTQLAGQTAQAGLGLVQPRAEVEKTSLELQAATQKYGPGIQLFQTLAPEAGIVDIPKTHEGGNDYAKMAEIGLNLAAQKVRKQRAVERLQEPTYKEGEGKGGTKVLFKFNKFGEQITPELESQLRAEASAPLQWQSVTPGTTAASPSAANVTPVEKDTPEIMRMRAQLINRNLITNDEANNLAPSEIRARFNSAQPSAMVTPAGSNATQENTLKMGEKIPGVGMVLSEAGAQKEQTPEKITQEILSLNALDKDIQEARSIIAGQNVVGPAIGSPIARGATQVGAAVGVGAEEHRRVAQRKLEILRSQKVLEGAQKMKGNLSDKDVRFLQDTIPQLSDDETVWNDYLNKWEAMNAANKKILLGELPKGYSVLDNLGASSAAQPAAAASTGPIADIPGIGKVRRRADGSYERVQ